MPNATPVSAAVLERSRKYHALTLQRLASVGQARVAEDLSVSESTISRCVNEHLERTLQVLAAAGLKVVPSEMRCYPEDQIEALFTLAKARLKAMESAEKLIFEEE